MSPTSQDSSTGNLILPYELRMEAMSVVYVRALAARAGYKILQYEHDYDGIDLRIQGGGTMRPAIEIQVKSTARNIAVSDGILGYDLNVRNYETLRVPTQTPRLLVLVQFPENEESWLSLDFDQLIIRGRAYWLNLTGGPDIQNTSSIRVRIPTGNLLDVLTLQGLMDQSKEGEI